MLNKLFIIVLSLKLHVLGSSVAMGAGDPRGVTEKDRLCCVRDNNPK